MNIRSPGNIFRLYSRDKNVCLRCTYRHHHHHHQRGGGLLGLSGLSWLLDTQTQTQPQTRPFTQTLSTREVAINTTKSSRLKNGYFLSNRFLPRTQGTQDASGRRSTTSTTTAEDGGGSSGDNKTAGHNHIKQDLPHRRRQAARRSAASTSASSASEPAPAPAPTPNDVLMPQDASSALTTASTKHPAHSLRRQLSLYLSLSKPRLTVLVVLTAMAPYALYPVPAFLSPSIGLDTPSLSPLTLTFLTTGTALCSASANAFNMLYEPKWDAQMTRTRNRPLVRGLLSSRKAITFAVLAAILGISALYFGVNPTVAFLGASNIVLYAGIYTPMKRLSWLNTWVGALVGGIPPLMGWAAAAGESATGDGSFRELLLTPDAAGGWLFAALLFAWQFPHFMALSWSIREEYRHAGHQMLCWVNPARNARVALRYSLAFIPICVGLCAAGVTDWSFAVTSLPVNLWLAREAVRFWRAEGAKGTARGLFWASVWHLPVVMVLALAQKKGMWGRVWRSVFGEPEDLDDDEYEDVMEWIEDDDDYDVKLGIRVARDAESSSGRGFPATAAGGHRQVAVAPTSTTTSASTERPDAAVVVVGAVPPPDVGGKTS